MTVKLSERSEQLVAAELKAGRHTSVDEIIDFALQACLADEGMTYDEVVESLRAAVKEPTIPYREDEFVEMVTKAIRERQA